MSLTFNEFMETYRPDTAPVRAFAKAWEKAEKPPFLFSRKHFVAHLLCCGFQPDEISTAKRVFAKYNKARLAR